jgi:carboxylesterase
MNQIISTAEPFFFPGKPGKPGCLLIHGFTGTPKEMRWMGEYLSEQGMHCLGIRLAGHATRPEAMIRSRFTDWMASVEDGYYLVRDAMRLSKDDVSQPIFLVGLSMGGILALLMSTRLQVSGVIAMSTPYNLPYDYPVGLLRVVSLFVKFQPKGKEEPGAGWFDKAAFAEHISYERNPVRSAAELQKLAIEMQTALPLVDVPVLLMHSHNDTYVSPVNLEYIYSELGTQDKHRLYVTEAGHVITRDKARDEVFRAAVDFIKRVESGR